MADMSSAPRTSREALIAEMLGDLDKLLDRVEALPPLVTGAEDRLAGVLAELEKGSDQYRLAITAFNEQAKADLGEYYDRKALEVTARTIEEQRATLQDVAREAFSSVATDKAAGLTAALGEAIQEFHRSKWARLAENAITAGIASILTATAVYLLLK